VCTIGIYFYGGRHMSEFQDQKKKMAKKIWGIAALVFFAVGGFLLMGITGRKTEISPEKASRPVKTMTLLAPEVTFRRIFPGKVIASKTAELSFRVSGPLVELPVKKGASIQQGSLIARIDPRDFRIQLTNAQSALSNASAQLDAMKAGARKEEISALSSKVSSAKARLSEAETDYQRMNRLFDGGVVAQVDLERAKTTYEVAKGELNTASQQLQEARSGARVEDIKAMEATIQGLKAQVEAAQSALKDTELRAPFNGIVAERYVDNYQSVQKNQTIISLQNLERIEIIISVPEQDIMRIKTYRSPSFFASFEASPGKKYPLEFKEITTKADPQTQTYAATFSMPYPEDFIALPGMTTQIEIVGEGETKGTGDFLVPSIAVVPGEDTKHFVWIVDEKTMTVHKAEVSLLSYKDDMAIIRGGVNTGSRIVIAGVHYLVEGDSVTFFNSEE
jgi:multidrug efflux system membrane fusion protein